MSKFSSFCFLQPNHDGVQDAEVLSDTLKSHPSLQIGNQSLVPEFLAIELTWRITNLKRYFVMKIFTFYIIICG